MKLRQPIERSASSDLGARPVKELDQAQSYAIYGRSGSGKTTFAASFPKPLLLLDINDRGTDSIADVEDIDVKEVSDTADIQKVYFHLRTEKHGYKTVVFDTVTQLQQLYMVEQARKKNRQGDVNAWGTLTRQDWGEVAGILNKWIADFRNLPMEVIFLCQERVSSEEEGADSQLVPSVGAAVMPSVANTLNAAVRVIGNTFIRNKMITETIEGKTVRRTRPQYCLRVGPNPIYTTKIRKPKTLVAPDFIVNPTYRKVLDIVKGRSNEKS